MNSVNFNQTGGFPLETDTLTFMENAYAQLAALAGLGGQNYILSGAVVTGTAVSAGVVVIAGEVLPLVAGTKQTYLAIQETVENRTFESGESKPVFTTRQAVFAGAGVVEFDSLVRISTILQLESNIEAVQTSVAALAATMVTQEAGFWTANVDGNDGKMAISLTQGLYYKTGKMIHLSGMITVTNISEDNLSRFKIGGLPSFVAEGVNFGLSVGTGQAYFGFPVVYESVGIIKDQTSEYLEFSINMLPNSPRTIIFSIDVFLP